MARRVSIKESPAGGRTETNQRAVLARGCPSFAPTVMKLLRTPASRQPSKTPVPVLTERAVRQCRHRDSVLLGPVREASKLRV